MIATEVAKGKMKGDKWNKNLVLSVSCSIIVLNGSDGGDAVRIGAAMLQTQLGARHILLAGPKGHANMNEVGGNEQRFCMKWN